MKNLRTIIAIITLYVSVASCTKDKTDDFANNVISYKQYLPMHVGDVQLYRMDSIVPTAFGVKLDTISYIAKDSVAVQRLDAVGDTTFDVVRYITDTLRTLPWSLSTTYQIVYTKNTGDLIQLDGKRFIKLTTPVREGYNWDGNQYFMTGQSTGSSNPDYTYAGWNYVYESVGASYNTNYASYQNSITVNEINKIPDFDPNTYNEEKYAQEIYAEGVGLIYQNISFYIYQPPNGESYGYDLRSFGIRLTRIQ